MSNGTVNISVALYWPVKLPNNYTGAVSVSFYTPQQSSYARLVHDWKTGNSVIPKPRFEENNIPTGGNVNLCYQPEKFILPEQKPVNSYALDIRGKPMGEKKVEPFVPQKSFISLKNTDLYSEQVVFTAHVHIKVHTNLKYSRKWQSCGKICVLGKYLRANLPVCLPVFLRSSYVVEGIPDETVLGWLRINTDTTIQTPNSPTITFEQRLFDAFVRNVAHEKALLAKHLQFKEGSGGLCISYASHYADGVLFDEAKFTEWNRGVAFTKDQIKWLVGTSPQSSFYYIKPVATASYFLQNLRECLAMHNQTDADFITQVNLLYRFDRSQSLDGPEENKHLLRRLISDVIKVYYLYFITRPYAPDISFYVENGELKPQSGDFTDAFHMGDCEDGAIGIHKMILTMLFHQWSTDSVYMELSKGDRDLFDSLRLCTAMLGLPVGIVGESRSPETNKKGGGHMYGALVPLEKYIKALYTRLLVPVNWVDVMSGKKTSNVDESLEKGRLWFFTTFGQQYPGDLDKVMALESTMFATPRYDSHTHVHEGVAEAYQVLLISLRDKGMISCGWFNITYTHLLGMAAVDDNGTEFRKEVHHLSDRGFTSAYLYMFDNITDYNTAFYFQSLCDEKQPNGLYFNQLFCDKDSSFVLIPSDPGSKNNQTVSRQEYETELFLNKQIHRPDPLLDVNTKDVFNDEQWDNIALCLMKRHIYTESMYAEDQKEHSDAYKMEAYSEHANPNSICNFSYEQINRMVTAFNAIPRSEITEQSHVTLFVYAWYPSVLIDIYDFYTSIGAVSIRLLKYGWCTAVVFNISTTQ